jgi:hypothetical protein
MLNKEQELVDMLNSGNFKVYTGGNKSRLRRIIKNHGDILSQSTIQGLWDIKLLQWDIVRNIKLPSSMIDNILKNISDVNLRVYQECLLHQKLTNNQLKDIHDFLISDVIEHKIYGFLAWEVITKKMLKVNNVLDILQHIDSQISSNKKTMSSTDVASVVAKICKNIKDHVDIKTFNAFLNGIISNIYVINDYLLQMMSKLYIEDQTLYSIRNNEDLYEQQYKNFIELLIKRNNCSKKFKLKYLLKK